MKICIIGGGTTGWWAAGYLEKQFPDYDITLIESSDIPIIGVGESTLPQISQFFEDMGMSEDVWMEKCNATKKIGNLKSNWDKPDGEEFSFTFWFNDNNVFDEWKQQYDAGIVDKHNINDQLYNKDGWQATAYHFDAAKAGTIVKDNCKNVTHIIDTLDKLPDGYDLYLDCTGFRRAFVKDNTELALEHHLIDRTWVCPFESQAQDHRRHTQSVARSSGWQFIVNLTNRTGSGYAFSSTHQTEEDALVEFNKINAHRTPFMGKSPKLLRWNPSVLSNPWHDNVVAIGLSSGFIDPLESNALFMTQFSITTLAKCLQRGYGNKTYNRAMRNVWKDNSEYIKHHYMLSDRTDTEFWKYYSKFDASKTVWENYHKSGNKYTNLYPDAIWATLALYFGKMDHYEKK